MNEELNNAVAVEVMGWTISQGDIIELDENARPPNFISGTVKYFHPSKSISDAWQVVEKMQERGFLWLMGTVDDGIRLRFYKKEGVVMTENYTLVSNSVCHLICEVALGAVRKKEKE